MQAPNSNSKISVLKEPTLAEAAILIEKAFAQRRTLLVAGNCHVHYNGRASSTLEYGERLLFVKSDGAVLVHRPVGYEPVNWQPAGSVFHVEVKDDKLEVHGVRTKPRENLRVIFSSVLMVSSLALADSGAFLLHASEDDMHRAILVKPQLFEEGFKPISWEKKVQPGFVDIFGEDKDGNLVVIEVKRRVASKDAVLQLAKYIEPIKSKVNRPVRAVLVAPSLGKDVQRLLVSMGLEFKALDPKDCALALKKAETSKLESFFG
ncbi:MAG: endonuclease NucS [Candidatus Bathyarchaeota archaeon]|nr:endonuclease NucS [Candidatus Bathyarchaeota archaeon]